MDDHVTVDRTKISPFASGVLTPTQGACFLGSQLLLGFCILLQLNKFRLVAVRDSIPHDLAVATRMVGSLALGFDYLLVSPRHGATTVVVMFGLSYIPVRYLLCVLSYVVVHPESSSGAAAASSGRGLPCLVRDGCLGCPLTLIASCGEFIAPQPPQRRCAREKEPGYFPEGAVELFEVGGSQQVASRHHIQTKLQLCFIIDSRPEKLT